MSISHTLTLSLTTGGVALSKEITKSAGAEANVSETVNDAQTDVEIAFAAVRSKIKSLYIVADVAMTVETNDGTTPDDSFSLAANEPVVWHENCGIAINDFLAADITSIFATNASGSNGTLEIRCLLDPT